MQLLLPGFFQNVSFSQRRQLGFQKLKKANYSSYVLSLLSSMLIMDIRTSEGTVSRAAGIVITPSMMECRA